MCLGTDYLHAHTQGEIPITETKVFKIDHCVGLFRCLVFVLFVTQKKLLWQGKLNNAIYWLVGEGT